MILFIVVFALCGTRRAHADEVDGKAQAKSSFFEGRRLYDIGEYRGALEAFKKAYLLYEEASFLFNIAQCDRQLGDKVGALKAYRSYLIRSPEAPNRAEVRRLIALLESAIAQDAKASQAPPPPDTIVAPVERPGAPAHAVSRGAAAAPASTPAAAHTVAAAPVTTPEPARSDRPRPAHKRWWVWTAVAVGAAAVGVGVGLGVYYGTRFEPTLRGFSQGSALTVRF